MKIKIISTFWNCSDYIVDCIKSVKNQTYKDFEMYLIDDMSNDNTIEKIRNEVHGEHRFKLIINTQKKYKLKNLDDLILDEDLMHDEDIIVELDGDDRLYDENVLDKIFQKYKYNSDLWITNGSFIYSNGNLGFSSKVNPFTIRKDVFTFSHLRTWKVHV